MIKHILKDGTEVKDITGHVVKKEDAPMVYDLVERISRKEGKKND